MRQKEQDGARPLAARFRSFVENRDFPCVGAKSALGREQMRFLVARSLTASDDDRRLLEALHRFIDDYRREPTLFTSFVAVFEGPLGLSEAAFEQALWERLEALHRLDRRRYRWDPRVSADPDSSRFSFSLKQEACFVVGLHGAASRRARRFERPTLVFNLHDQFERLRAERRYEALRDAIRARDLAFDGTPNPMVAGHGEASEARQYSGRRVEDDWRCPFHALLREAA